MTSNLTNLTHIQINQLSCQIDNKPILFFFFFFTSLTMPRLVTSAVGLSTLFTFLNIVSSLSVSASRKNLHSIIRGQEADGRWPKDWTRQVGSSVTQLNRKKIKSLHKQCHDLPKVGNWGQAEVKMCRREVSTAIALGARFFQKF